MSVGTFNCERRQCGTSIDRRLQCIADLDIPWLRLAGETPVENLSHQREIGAPKRPHQDFESPVLVEHHLRNALSGKQCQ